jgi:hypothetical protein
MSESKLVHFNDPSDPGYSVRLTYETRADMDGEVTWVDFELLERVTGTDSNGGPPLWWAPGDTMDELVPYEQASARIKGFVKWDGCTQFRLLDDLGVHVDSTDDLECWLDAVRRCRVECAEVIKASRGGTWEGD